MSSACFSSRCFSFLGWWWWRPRLRRLQGFSLESSQFQLVGNLGGDLLEPDGGAGDAFEPDPVEREAWQFAHLDLPLDKRVGVGVAVNAEQQEPLPLLVITIVGIQNLQQQNRNSNELEV